jgi:hypothetical protein
MIRSNEWGESLEATVKRSRLQGSLLVYSMVEGEEITIGMSGQVANGVEATESRVIRARSLGLSSGAIEVLDDSDRELNWRNRIICLGSFAYNLGNVEFQRAGLLRGYIGHDKGVVVDLSAQHFTEQLPPEFLLAQYKTLALEGQKIF